MKPYSFQPEVLLRAPAFSYQEFRNRTLQQWLDFPYFLKSIALANKVVYRELQKADFRESLLNDKMKRTLRNYVNRMHHRCVPFGMFAGFSKLYWQKPGEQQLPAVVGDQVNLFLISDQQEMIQELSRTFPDNFKNYEYYVNPSFYQVKNGNRYIKAHLQADGSAVSYSIATVQQANVFKWLFATCKTKVPFADILRLLVEETGHLVEETRDYLYQLIQEGILITHLGSTYISLGTNKISPIIIDKNRKDQQDTLLNPNIHPAYYANMEHNILGGNIDLSHQQNVEDGLIALSKLTAHLEPDALRKFKSDFVRRFDQQVLPLLVALDPELGIGYANLELEPIPSQILEGVRLDPTRSKYKELHWNEVHSLLLEKMQDSSLEKMSIALGEAELAQLPDDETPLPPGMSVLFRVSESQVFLESCGGATATALTGRFSIFDEQFKAAIAAIARNEIECNPEVLFAEIECLQELHVLNVELRSNFFDYKIEVVSNTGNVVAQNIMLSDLWVTVRNNKIILWSESLDKEVIPRLSTAYNIQRSELNVYRFLCELQYQGIRTNFHFDLGHYFPRLNFYPRVTYKNTILSLASWKINAGQLQEIRHTGSKQQQAEKLKYLLSSVHCKGIISIGEGDTQLVYDADHIGDLQLLLENIGENEYLTIKEFPFLSEEGAAINPLNRPFVSQYVANLTHSNEVFKKSDVAFPDLISINGAQRNAGNWLYMKLYCHASKADEQLLNHIAPLIRKLQSEKNIRNWHFIRYNDPEFHIRLRFECYNSFGKASIWLRLNEVLEPLQNQGVFSDIKTDKYLKELERYYPYDITGIEHFFCCDSMWVFDLLRIRSYEDELAYAVSSSELIISSMLEGDEVRVNFSKTIFDSFCQEFKGGRPLQQSILKKYAAYRAQLEAGWERRKKVISRLKPFSGILKVIKNLKEEHSDPASLLKLCADLVHMHLNRFFSDHPREKEMVIHYFLWRHYSMALHKSGKL